MNIQLKNTRVEHFSIRADEEIEKDDFKLGFSTGYPEVESDFFVVIFDVKIGSKEGYWIDLKFIAEFKTDEIINEAFKGSTFPIVNAPAIAYPYMRSYVSLVTLNSGYNPLILGTVNFQAMAKAKKAKEQEQEQEQEQLEDN